MLSAGPRQRGCEGGPGLLGILNIADNGIMNEGLQLVLEGLSGNENLVSLNVSNNELTHVIIP